MMERFTKKIFLVLLFLIILINVNNSTFAYDNFNKASFEDLKFKQEISIPFDTSDSQAKYQPVDLKINFENECYGTSINQHSIRVGCDIGSEILELESQIYDLEIENDKILSCGLVFLIPEQADGSESYYIYYDKEKTEDVFYEKHISLVDSHYFYEPISGQKIDIDYYGIKEKDDFIYGICQTGELLGNPIALSVIKFKPGTKIVETYNIDQLAVFDMRYGINPQPGYRGTSWAKEVKKTVLVNGNLMIKVRLEAISLKGDIISDNIYTYYYSPTENKKIVVDCYHEVLKDISVEEPSLLDGTYGGIVSIKSRSQTIEKMNVGNILPELYVYTEDENIFGFSVPTNPSTVEREAVVSTEDDIDLGEAAWVCSKDPEQNLLHGLILDSNKGLIKGEGDGVQVKVWVKENIKLPGLEADTGNLYIARNSYENKKHDPNLKKGFKVNYKVEFFTLKNKELESINKRSEIFQKSVLSLSSARKNITQKETAKEDRFTLTTYVYNAYSFPLGSLLSAAVGKKLPYIYAELYKENDFKSSGSVSRLSLGSVDINLEGKTFNEKLKTILGIFDIKNSSLFKKIIFPDIGKGNYVVKIYRENTVFSKERKYIGFGIVNVTENTTLRIYCKPETKASFNIKDQNENGVKNAEFYILFNENIISDGKSDINGSISLSAPVKIKDKYLLRILYKGFLISEEEIKLGYLNNIFKSSKDFKVNLFDLNIKLRDKWGFVPSVEASIQLRSSEMFDDIFIQAENLDRENYYFLDLPKAGYDLNLKYKSFDLNEKIDLDIDKSMELVFPAEYKTSFNLFNRFGEEISKAELYLSRNGKKIKSEINENGFVDFTIPPGNYKIEVFSEGEKVAYQNIDIKSQKTIDILANIGSLIHNLISYLSIILILLSLFYMFFKKKYQVFIKIIVVFLLIISVFQPWWYLSGSNNDLSTETKTMLYPPKIISFTDSTEGLGGSVNIIPEELSSVLFLLSLMVFVLIIIILFEIFTNDRFRKINFSLKSFEIIIPIAVVFIFYYAMSLVTKLGVGSFIGSDLISVTVPGQVQNLSVYCSWGPGIGFYLVILSIIILFFSIFYKKTCIYRKFLNK